MFKLIRTAQLERGKFALYFPGSLHDNETCLAPWWAGKRLYSRLKSLKTEMYPCRIEAGWRSIVSSQGGRNHDSFSGGRGKYPVGFWCKENG